MKKLSRAKARRRLRGFLAIRPDGCYTFIRAFSARAARQIWNDGQKLGQRKELIPAEVRLVPLIR